MTLALTFRHIFRVFKFQIVEKEELIILDIEEEKQ